jgi:Uncharacterised protein family (UPF0175)
MASQQVALDIRKSFFWRKGPTRPLSLEVRILAVVKFNELGRQSAGRAAELAGMERVELFLALGHSKVFPFQAELMRFRSSS